MDNWDIWWYYAKQMLLLNRIMSTNAYIKERQITLKPWKVLYDR